ncbi:MAG: Holliday junction branch migration protein RuvA [Nitrospinota bacterium]|nr:MAG: Holliday junction branch migration protein RuvA [Nitrospinota bacterium]
MIAYLRGILIFKAVDQVILDVQGVGYQLLIPLSTYHKLPALSAEVTLFTYMQVRDESITLFGFASPEEKALFAALIRVSQVGPKMALNILSRMPREEFQQAVLQGDIQRIRTIPGIGKRTAERIVLELKDTLAPPSTPSSSAVRTAIQEDAIAALVSLGYTKSVAVEVVEQLTRTQTDGWSAEELIRASLKTLGSRDK